MAISVIIPIANGDKAWREMLPDLEALGSKDEIIFVATDRLLTSVKKERSLERLHCSYSFHLTEVGRAKQLNFGAKKAKNEFLWFLHCDSRFSKTAFDALGKSILIDPAALHFFDLKFSKDGPVLMRLNELGVWIRSRMLRLPFGDQALAMSRTVFRDLGGFRENVPCGEDHLLVWRAHQLGVGLRCVGAPHG